MRALGIALATMTTYWFAPKDALAYFTDQM